MKVNKVKILAEIFLRFVIHNLCICRCRNVNLINSDFHHKDVLEQSGEKIKKYKTIYKRKRSDRVQKKVSPMLVGMLVISEGTPAIRSDGTMSNSNATGDVSGKS